MHSDSKYSATNLSSPPPPPVERPSSASAARQVPAGQPSIRRLSVATAAGSSLAPRFRRRSSSSRWLSASSAAPSSKRRPAARARATPRRIVRPASANVEPAGTCSARARTRASEPRERSRCTSSRTRRTGRSRASSVAGRAVGERRPSARPRDARSTCGSLSASSTDSQAKRLSSRAAHCASSVDLPYPAGAQTVTSGAPEARSLLTSGVRTTLSARTSDGRSSRSSAPRTVLSSGMVVWRAVTSSRSCGPRGRPVPAARLSYLQSSATARVSTSGVGCAHRLMVRLT